MRFFAILLLFFAGSVYGTPLPDGVYDCGKSSSRFECNPCVGESWFSKETSVDVNAIQICKDQGYSGLIHTYGSTGGVVCRYSDDKGGGDFTSFGDTVSWQCDTSVPRNEPTFTPTVEPTSTPTSYPTSTPTVEPTTVPTGQPSIFPTEMPTPTPTNEPTQYPTGLPSSLPTEIAIPAPTKIPTELPTTSTVGPTQHPTGTPTEFALFKQTFLPTPHPTTDTESCPETVGRLETVIDYLLDYLFCLKHEKNEKNCTGSYYTE